MKKILTLGMSIILLSASMTVNAAEASITAKQNADYMMSTNKEGIPNWFNGVHYSDRYEDLRIAFHTNEKALYNHSLQYGFNESRLVTPILDVAKYRSFYPDLNKAYGDNWNLYIRHYFEYGINEGRDNFTDFDAGTYLSLHDDLQNAFGTDLGLATRHYIEFGLSEGRECSWSKPGIAYGGTNNDNGSSDSDSTDENFTGEKRIELSDNMYAIETYVNGVITAVTCYNPDGTEEYKTIFNYDENTVLISDRTYYPDGTSDETTYYGTGVRKTITVYRADGTKSRYVEHNEQGYTTFSIEYQEDGETEFYKATFTYDENGNLKFQRDIWSDGSITEETYENGIRIYQVSTHGDGTRVEIEYYPDGQTKKKETTTNTDGTKIVAEFYENGNWKSLTTYDAGGNITS